MFQLALKKILISVLSSYKAVLPLGDLAVSNGQVELNGKLHQEEYAREHLIGKLNEF